jgi:hypothetical protein
LVIRVLLNGCDGWLTVAASPKTTDHEQPMQIAQGGCRNARQLERHAGTSSRLKHPARHDSNDAWLDLDMDDATVRSLFAIVRSHTSAKERMPAIVNFNFLPDMGRMDA